MPQLYYNTLFSKKQVFSQIALVFYKYFFTIILKTIKRGINA